MKFLILTVTTGQGHNQTALAVKDEIEKRGCEVVMLDAFEHISTALKSSVSKGYLFSTAISPKAYGKFYRAAEKKDPESLVNFRKILNSKKITDYINEYSPDVIICSHVFAAMTFQKDALLSKGIRVAGIITDFTILPYWNETSLDYYILPHEKLCYQARKKGIPGTLLPFGIPISPEFANKESKASARAKLGIPDKTTVLIMSGSMGYGKVYKNLLKINELSEDFQIICVCGNNADLKNKIDKKKLSKIALNFGFTKEVPLLMDASDFIITKPGGITVSEALSKELPIIIANPIPGQEERNSEFLLNVGGAVKATKTFPIDELLCLLLNDKEMAEIIEGNIRKIKKPNAAKELVEFFIKKD